MYKGIKAITKKFNPKLDVVKDELGNVLYEWDDIKWCGHWTQWKHSMWGTNGISGKYTSALISQLLP